ncbi:hypothetical protein HMPREF1054_0919 [Haemophilus paraphrohaemolyticus HK411]|uniref:Uncharacterized protein n=1 Tax=Haemophilus paraphrohaemolyticus HK411 TaxID=1095743 RepID=I2NFQ9_9PAST|nr:hypothetical protein HMPREF1054_0919 [Haemophilus paraphrohaemolyticus HK411]
MGTVLNNNITLNKATKIGAKIRLEPNHAQPNLVEISLGI